MLSQRVARAAGLHRGFAAVARTAPPVRVQPWAAAQRRGFTPYAYDKKVVDEMFPDPPTLTEAEDPDMNGGYVNPPRIKRQFRDPYADWWDPQERRNFGEPVHEDNDMLGMFSTYEYTWTKAGPGIIMFGTFVVAFLGVSGIVYLTYPDRKTSPREFEGGLERELGGPGAKRARMSGDPDP